MGEFWEFLYSVNSTHLAIFFWNGTPNFQYQKIEKRNKRKKDTGVHMYTQSKNEESKV
jgi:5'-3' exonuclease